MPLDAQLFKTKFAHNLPPLECYFHKTERMLLRDTGQQQLGRKFFFAWNNLTEFELKQIDAIKSRLQADKIDIPASITDRDLLSFLNANFYDLHKAQVQLSGHFKWLSEVAGVTITPQIIRLIQSGSMYIFGRDKDYRITLVFDLPKIIHFSKTEPELISPVQIQNSFVFFISYMKRVMLLPGRCDHWNTIVDMGFAGYKDVPHS